jgi:hypothetical protein
LYETATLVYRNNERGKRHATPFDIFIDGRSRKSHSMCAIREKEGTIYAGGKPKEVGVEKQRERERERESEQGRNRARGREEKEMTMKILRGLTETTRK